MSAHRDDCVVIVVSWNVRDLLRECLRSVRDHGGLGEAPRVVVVDNASSDGTASMVRAEFPWVQLVANAENEGFIRANNRVARTTDARQFLLLNPDTVVKDGALGRLAAWMDAHPRAAVAGCRLLNSDGTLQRWTGGAFPTLWNVVSHQWWLDHLLPAGVGPSPMFRVADTREAEQVDWVSGACLSVRNGSFGESLFDESFVMYAEDVELCERVRRRGWEVWYVADATVVHHHGRSISQQSGALALEPVRGPRRFFASRNGPLAVLAYDVATVSGFLMRSAAFGVCALFASRTEYQAKARANRQSAMKALQVMWGA